MARVLHVVFFEPRIPGNSGAAIRLSANTGAMLHLVDPLFDMDDAKLRRAGLDYHDLARTRVHATWEECLEQVPGRIFAFTAHTTTLYTDIAWRQDDALLFGPEPTGLPEPIMNHPRVTGRARIPMLPGSRSLNLANSAAVGLYEAWRSLGFPGSTV
nr:tRNA (cytidine(34)-2'-O)-methyltransferase [Actinomyces sp. 565]